MWDSSSNIAHHEICAKILYYGFSGNLFELNEYNTLPLATTHPYHETNKKILPTTNHNYSVPTFA